LEQAQSVTLQVKDILQAAEEEAARPFGGGDADGQSINDGTEGDNKPSPLPLIGSDGLFSESYMDDMVGKDIQGAGDSDLIDAMQTLSGDASPEEISDALDKISAARDVPREQIQADYDRYLELRAEAERIGKANEKGEWEALNETLHSDFMGSTVQLRYGQVVGDQLGIDPVFGSLLNPTGGLVGAGNFPSAQFADESPISYHGVFHDAAGYLYNYHNIGPGYDYMGLEPNRDQGHPFTGQETGIPYWNEKMGAEGFIPDVSNKIGSMLGDVVDLQTWAEDSVDTVKKEFDSMVDTAQDVVDDIQDGFDDVIDFIF